MITEPKETIISEEFFVKSTSPTSADNSFQSTVFVRWSERDTHQLANKYLVFNVPIRRKQSTVHGLALFKWIRHKCVNLNPLFTCKSLLFILVGCIDGLLDLVQPQYCRLISRVLQSGKRHKITYLLLERKTTSSQ